MINIVDELKSDFLTYAAEVNNNRAFPNVIDGLKVSQRAALWEMFSKNYSSAKPHVKSAKVTGGTIASWHPHSDTSVYDVLVRMSQPWINNICEVDFHGANGSQLGGAEAASSRYTECRLSKASEEGFFKNIKKNTVPMIQNFSEDLTWPSVFPAIFPRLFVNGSQGIGYTIAQDWEPGNITEFLSKIKHFLTTGKITYDNIYPDYPSGGIIVNKSDMSDLYKTGKGTIILRGKTAINNNLINITELPYQVYVEPLIQKIKDLVNNNIITGIADICNKSGEHGLNIEIECCTDPELVLGQLFKLTDLQITLSANQMALVNGVPKLLNLEEYIKIYIESNLNFLQNETTFELNKATEKKELVDGFIKATDMIDEIIKLIKNSENSTEAMTKIMNLAFSENQAKAILDSKLNKLSKLEVSALKQQKIELDEIISKCSALLASSMLQNKEILNRLTTFTTEFGNKRHTKVIDLDLDNEKLKLSAKQTQLDISYHFVIQNNYLKKFTDDNYKKYLKTAHPLTDVLAGDKDKLILISVQGNMFKLAANKIPTCSVNANGIALSSFYKEKIIAVFSGHEDEQYMFIITSHGLAKKIETKLVFNLSKNVGAPIMKVNDGDTIIDCRLIDEGKTNKIDVIVGDKTKSIDTSKFISKGRLAGGVTAIKLSNKIKEITMVH